jgi:phosphohistidine phosphatase SixA
LIRHAESEENHRMYSLTRCFGQLGRLSLPSYSDVSTSLQLLHVQSQVDSHVSDVGREQIQHMQSKLQQANFVQTMGIQCVAHSPLERARQTCEGMLGCVAAPQPVAVPGVDRVVELAELTEKTPSEWIPYNNGSLYQRIAALETWLGAQPEPVIALVGHSQYFKAMLGLPFKFRNCDVWQVTFDGSQKSTPTIKTLTKEVTTTTTTTTEASKTKTTIKEGEESSSSSSWKLPPRWTNLQRLYTCEVSRTKEPSSPNNKS